MLSSEEIILTNALTVCSNVQRGRYLGVVKDQLTFARQTGRLVEEAISHATHVMAIPPILLSCAVELHHCSEKKVIFRVPAWGAIGYNDRRILKHPLRNQAKAWMASKVDLRDKSLQLDILSGDPLDWQQILGNAGGGEGDRKSPRAYAQQDFFSVEQGKGTTKRNCGGLPMEDSMTVYRTGGKRRRIGDNHARNVETPGEMNTGRLSINESLVPSRVVKMEQTDDVRTVLVLLTDANQPRRLGTASMNVARPYKDGAAPPIMRGMFQEETEMFLRRCAISDAERKWSDGGRCTPSKSTEITFPSPQHGSGAIVSPERIPSFYVLLPHFRDVLRDEIHHRVTAVERGMNVAMAAVESLGRQYQALAQEVSAIQEFMQIPNTDPRRAMSNPPARTLSSAAILPSVSILPHDGHPRSISLPPSPALHETPNSAFPELPAIEGLSVVPPRQINVARSHDHLPQAGLVTEPVHACNGSEPAPVGKEISQACEGSEVVGNAESNALVPGPTQVGQRDLTEALLWLLSLSEDYIQTGFITARCCGCRGDSYSRPSQKQKANFTYQVKAKGLHDLLINMKDKLIRFWPGRPALQISCSSMEW
ncbi:hypothetical protein BDR07DRAFT_1381329 [Suillus spraguei]|nr:hypothetical protein BDR07DRAFT_1381329 [Suillus spraguei]